MGKYIKIKYKKSKKFGIDIGLKTKKIKNINTKFKSKSTPIQHNKKKKTNNNYFSQLMSKQLIKYKYGIFEAQLKKYYKFVCKKKYVKNEYFLKILECRLDNIIYKSGFYSTISHTRQAIVHKFILIIRKKQCNNIQYPSYILKSNDIIKINHNNIYKNKNHNNWTQLDCNKNIILFKRPPYRNEIPKYINEQLVIEFFSK